MLWGLAPRVARRGTGDSILALEGHWRALEEQLRPTWLFQGYAKTFPTGARPVYTPGPRALLAVGDYNPEKSLDTHGPCEGLPTGRPGHLPGLPGVEGLDAVLRAEPSVGQSHGGAVGRGRPARRSKSTLLLAHHPWEESDASRSRAWQSTALFRTSPVPSYGCSGLRLSQTSRTLRAASSDREPYRRPPATNPGTWTRRGFHGPLPLLDAPRRKWQEQRTAGGKPTSPAGRTKGGGPPGIRRLGEPSSCEPTLIRRRGCCWDAALRLRPRASRRHASEGPPAWHGLLPPQWHL